MVSCILQSHLGEAHADCVSVLQDGGWRNSQGHGGVHHPGPIHVDRQPVPFC